MLGRFTLSDDAQGTFKFRIGLGGSEETFFLGGVIINGAMLMTLPAVLLPGDHDEDGDVDGHDFLRWQRGESASPFSVGDLAAWQANYGTVFPLSAASTAVPEPTTLMMALAVALTWPATGRRRR